MRKEFCNSKLKHIMNTNIFTPRAALGWGWQPLVPWPLPPPKAHGFQCIYYAWVFFWSEVHICQGFKVKTYTWLPMISSAASVSYASYIDESYARLYISLWRLKCPYDNHSSQRDLFHGDKIPLFSSFNLNLRALRSYDKFSSFSLAKPQHGGKPKRTTPPQPRVFRS